MDKAPRLAWLAAVVSSITAVLALWDKLSPILNELGGIATKLAATQLFGLWSFLLSVAFGIGIWWALWLHKEVCRWRPHSCSDLWSVAAGWGVYIAQQWIEGATDRQWAWAILLGAFAGLVAFLLSRLAWHFTAPPKGSP